MSVGEAAVRAVSITPTLRVREAARIMRDDVKYKTYQVLPLGESVAAFMHANARALADNTLDAYESTLNRFAWFFADLRLEDFEPPIGTERVEEFLHHEWGKSKATTYNRHLAALSSFFEWQRRRCHMTGDPTLNVKKARETQPYRTTFNASQRRAIIAQQDSLRDRIALRLLLDYGMRRGSLQQIQFKHFDHLRRRVTIFAKGGKVREMPLPDPDLWHDIERHILDSEAHAAHFLMQAKRGPADRPMTVQAMHKWWYRCLERAGLVEKGVNRGEKMHKARHTAGQRILDATGNLKAAQALLGHKSIATTGNIYVDHDIDQLTATLAIVLDEDRA